MITTHTTYTTKWAESDVLDYFWTMVEHHADRLELLQQLANVRIARAPAWRWARSS